MLNENGLTYDPRDQPNEPQSLCCGCLQSDSCGWGLEACLIFDIGQKTLFRDAEFAGRLWCKLRGFSVSALCKC